ncbi:SLBB domain-containing protein [Colwellia sp. UCD-KL20]|uniref:polysaccharide biosynthesis/export family protein n=1 Tax=Colwellia sp. UCD-KL20 TaxID=1917165 RepID=UPI000970D015|nr:SLBB domain-containing protein [Colwellia sp. UCD-KL20]
MTTFLHKSTLLLLVFLSCFSFVAFSAQLPSNISPQQLEQFKKLSPAQQKSLASSMGVDLSTIQSQVKKNNTNEDETKNLQQYYPRGTQFDEMGNPIGLSEEELAEEDEDELKPFGYDVFANAPLTFAPSIDIAIPDDYTIGSGDVLSVQMFGKENNEYELIVSREGKVTFPELGAFKVAGMTFEEVKKYLKNEIQNKVLGVDIVLTLAELRSIRVFVLGEAFKPGNYLLSSLSSITHAIFSAGGISDIGSLRNVQLKRAGKLVSSLDLYDLLINGDSSSDVLLKSGDVIFIPPVGSRISIDGEVKRPAIYELKKEESFNSILKMAGGMLPSAYPSSTIVERYNNRNLRSVVNIDLSIAENLAKKARAGDYIRVMATSSNFEDSVSIIGAVSRPGNYQWEPDQKVSDLLPNISSYLLENADLTYSIIVRQMNHSRDIEIIQFSIADALSDKNAIDNVSLKPLDKILVFSNVERNSQELTNLDEFLLTETELLEKEKEVLIKSYEDNLFWEQYGENAEPVNPFKEEDKAEETFNATKKSLRDLKEKNIEQELKPNEISFFSRQRLLAPVIKQLKRQASLNQPLKLVVIDGAVKYPGTYPLANNASVVDLIKAAGGLLESAFLQKAELSRFEVNNKAANKTLVNLNLADALASSETSFRLKSKDRLNINHIPAWQKDQTVELLGEFKFPGRYTVRRGETLAQLIERAGGFTEYADIQSSLFTREKLKQVELQNLIDVSQNLRNEIASKSLSQREGSQILDYEQANLLLADLTKVEPVGRLVVDIEKINDGRSFDILLEDGDALYVSPKQNTINVVGQVQIASSHLFEKGLTAFDYIKLSGGAKKQADEDRIYIIKANGAVEIPNNDNWFTANSGQLQPGDTVVVPLDSYFMDDLTLWQTATQILYQASVAVAAIARL